MKLKLFTGYHNWRKDFTLPWEIFFLTKGIEYRFTLGVGRIHQNLLQQEYIDLNPTGIVNSYNSNGITRDA